MSFKVIVRNLTTHTKYSNRGVHLNHFLYFGENYSFLLKILGLVFSQSYPISFDNNDYKIHMGDMSKHHSHL